MWTGSVGLLLEVQERHEQGAEAITHILRTQDGTTIDNNRVHATLQEAEKVRQFSTESLTISHLSPPKPVTGTATTTLHPGCDRHCAGQTDTKPVCGSAHTKQPVRR